MRQHGIRFVLPAIASVAIVFTAAAIASAEDAPDAKVGQVLSKLHHSNQKEVHMGQEAKEKGQSAATKEYGATLERDHTAADEKVAALARKRNVKLSEPPAGEPQHALPAGESFDAHFAKMMVDDHKKDIASVKSEHSATTDAELKELLGDLLPTLEKHLATAEALADGKKPGTEGKAAP